MLSRLFQGWAPRSLAVGAVATGVDICVLLCCVRWLGFPNPLAAAVGVAVGSTVAFFGNRTFAFLDCAPEMAPQATRFVLTTGVGLVAHASLVHVLADMFAVPVVLAKLVSDLAVFGVGMLFLLRYVVFPRSEKPRVRRGLALQPNEVKDSAARAA
jgi:putative flippase GtrA